MVPTFWLLERHMRGCRGFGDVLMLMLSSASMTPPGLGIYASMFGAEELGWARTMTELISNSSTRRVGGKRGTF